MRVFATGGRQGKSFDWKPNPSSDTTFRFVDGVCDLGRGGMMITEEGIAKPRPLPLNEIPSVVRYLQVSLQVSMNPSGEAPAGAATVGGDETNPIRVAIRSLDVLDETLWTDDGHVTVEAVARLIPTVTRAEIDAVAPDLTRETLSITA